MSGRPGTVVGCGCTGGIGFDDAGVPGAGGGGANWSAGCCAKTHGAASKAATIPGKTQCRTDEPLAMINPPRLSCAWTARCRCEKLLRSYALASQCTRYCAMRRLINGFLFDSNRLRNPGVPRVKDRRRFDGYRCAPPTTVG